MKKKIIIIGAGPAGLTNAYYLLKNSREYDVTILEKDLIVGGISKTVEFDGYKMDTGIHRFFTKNDEVFNIWKEILPLQGSPSYDDILLKRNKKYEKNGSNPEKDDKTFLIRDRVTRIYYGNKFYDYPVSLNLTTIINLGFINVLKAGVSYLKSCIIKVEEKSLEDFYINRFGKVLYSMFFESYTEKVWGVHPRNISADWGSQRVKGLSITEIIKDFIGKKLKIKNSKNTETSLIETFYYPKLGSGQMYQEMTKKIIELGGRVITRANVKELKFEGNQINKVVYEKDGKENIEECDICISSMPIKNLINSFDTEVSEKIKYITNNLPYREFMSVGLVVDKINLKNTTKIRNIRNLVPDSWIYIQEPGVKMGRIQIFNNWSPYIFPNKRDFRDKVFISAEYFCEENDKYYNMSDERFIKFTASELKKLGIIKNEKIIYSHRVKIEKAYPAYFGTYKEIEKVIEYLDTIDNLYCIGRNGQHRYNNMDHSMLTGIETAKCILCENKNKSIIWKVNTEKEYHESK